MKEEEIEKIVVHIQKRKAELDQLISLWNHVKELHDTVGLKESTFKDIQSKVSSKMAQCERSIKDHEKLLKH